VIEFSINGDRFSAEMAEISRKLYSFEVQKVFVAAARGVATVVRGNAPRRSGRLRKAVKVSGVRPSVLATRGPSAAALINLKGNRGTTAPHGHLVEGGTKNIAGRFFFAKSVATAGEPAITRAMVATEKIILAGLGRGR